MSLIEIWEKNDQCKSDKRVHGYLNYYEEEWKNIRKLELTILEIGVFEGKGLCLLREYFPKAKIYGCDIDHRRLFDFREKIEKYGY